MDFKHPILFSLFGLKYKMCEYLTNGLWFLKFCFFSLRLSKNHNESAENHEHMQNEAKMLRYFLNHIVSVTPSAF